RTDRLTNRLDRNLPTIMENVENASTKLSDVADHFKQFKDLMGTVHGANPDKSMVAYGTGLLSFLSKQDSGRIGVKKPGTKEPLKQAVPAKQWAEGAKSDAHFLSLVCKNKGEMLHGLAKTQSLLPLFIQVKDQAPRLLADYLKEAHPDSRGVE